MSLDDSITSLDVSTDRLFIRLLWDLFHKLLLFNLVFHLRVQQLVKLVNFLISLIMLDKVSTWSQWERLWVYFFAIMEVWIFWSIIGVNVIFSVLDLTIVNFLWQVGLIFVFAHGQEWRIHVMIIKLFLEIFISVQKGLLWSLRRRWSILWLRNGGGIRSLQPFDLGSFWLGHEFVMDVLLIFTLNSILLIRFGVRI